MLKVYVGGIAGRWDSGVRVEWEVQGTKGMASLGSSEAGKSAKTKIGPRPGVLEECKISELRALEYDWGWGA